MPVFTVFSRDMKLWLNRFVVGCLYGILLTPLVFQQRLMHPLVISKTLFFQLIVELALTGYVTLAIFHKEYRPRITPLFIAVCAVFSAIVLSGVFGVNGARSVWSVPERMTGIVLMAHLTAYFIMLSGMRRSFLWTKYVSASVGISFFVALFPVIQLMFPAIFFDKIGDRLSGTIGNPIFLSAYLFFHIFIAAFLAEKSHAKKSRWWPYALIGVFDLAVILLTQTRGAVVAVGVSLIVLSAYAVFGVNKGAIRKVIGITWLITALFAGGFWATRENAVWRGVPVLSRLATEGFRADNRLIAWRAGLLSFMEHPVTGVGWENFLTAFDRHYEPRLLRNGFSETFFDRPHNVFVQFLTETGIVGFVAYVLLLGIALYLVRKEKWIIALLAAYVTQNFFAFDSISTYVIFFAVLAWIDAEFSAHRETPLAPLLGSRGNASAEVLAASMFTLLACAGIYFLNYRPYAASRLEWTSVNYFVQGDIADGVEYMEKALMAKTPYHNYIAKDLYPNIALLYKQDLPLPDVRNLVEKAVRGMTEAAEAEPLNYGFWVGLADMMQPISGLDARYIDQGIIALDRADAISPRRQATLYVRAKLLNLKGDKAGALKAMADAVALDPEVGDAHFYYALLLLEGSDMVGGLRELARAAELGRVPRNAIEASVVAAQLGDLGAYKESAFYFQKALLFNPDNLEISMKLGLVYYFSGDKDAARRLIANVMSEQDLKRSPQYQSLLPILRDLGLLK